MTDRSLTSASIPYGCRLMSRSRPPGWGLPRYPPGVLILPREVTRGSGSVRAAFPLYQWSQRSPPTVVGQRERWPSGAEG
jgi:hypothetical protein